MLACHGFLWSFSRRSRLPGSVEGRLVQLVQKGHSSSSQMRMPMRLDLGTSSYAHGLVLVMLPSGVADCT